MNHSLGSLLVQKNDEGFEQAIYHLSRILIGAESRYNPVEKECLALVFAIQKTRYYLIGQTIHVISRVNSLRILMTNPGSLSFRLANWAILLSQYDMIFMPQKAIKGQALADFLAAHLVLETSKLHEGIPDEVVKANMTSEDEVQQMFFDGASRMDHKGKIVAGVGVCVLPHNLVLPRTFSLTESCSNNVAEYNTLLIGLRLARQMRYNTLKPMVTP